RREIERLQRTARFKRIAIMANEKVAIDKEDIRLDTRKSVVQCVEKGASMQVVIMCVRIRQRCDISCRTIGNGTYKCCAKRYECTQLASFHRCNRLSAIMFCRA